MHLLLALFRSNGLQTRNNNGSGSVQKWFGANFWKSLNADYFYFYADYRISNNIFHFVTFDKLKTTCPFIGNKSLRLSYLNGLLTKLPGEHIALFKSSWLAPKPVAEAFVIVLARLNPATADLIRRVSPVPLVWSKFTHFFRNFF